MRKIFKYQFVSGGRIEIPKNAEIVHVEEQDGVLCMWAIVNPDAPKETRTFCIRGTGHPIDESLKYVKTWQAPPFVWHLFEQSYL